MVVSEVVVVAIIAVIVAIAAVIITRYDTCTITIITAIIVIV